MARAIRTPNAWALAQREFREAYVADPASVPRQDVQVRWWQNPPPATEAGLIGLATGILGTLWRWWGGRGMSEGTFVAVFSPTATAPTATVPARPLIQFPVADGLGLPEPVGSSDATLAGEVGLNGRCCVELPDGTVLWPISNPVIPTRRSLPAPR